MAALECARELSKWCALAPDFMSNDAFGTSSTTHHRGAASGSSHVCEGAVAPSSRAGFRFDELWISDGALGARQYVYKEVCTEDEWDGHK